METWPATLIPNNISINCKANNKMFTSSLNNASTSVGFMGDKWSATLTFNTLDNFEGNTDIEDLQSFIWSLAGTRGKFKMWVFNKKGAPAKGNPKVNGSTNSGSSCITDGWNPSTLILKRGDYISINNELKFIKNDVTSNSAGGAVISFLPPIRFIPPDNTPIITERAYGVFRLADDDQGDFSLTPGTEATVSIEVVECISYV